MQQNRKGPLNMVAASVCWSLGGLLIRFIPWSAMSIIGLRALLAAGVFALWRRSVKVEFTRGNLLAALCLAATTMLFVFANQMTTAAAAILLQFTAPAFIILIRFVFYKARPKAHELLAVALIACGMLLFFAEQMQPGNLLGNLLAVGSGLSFAGVFVCNKRPDTKPEQAMFLGFLINAMLGLPFAFFGATADPVAWGLIFVMGVVQVGLAYVFFTAGIQSTPALLACLITALEPVLNPVWVAVVLGEVPGPFALAGGIVIIGTVVSYNIWVEKRAAKADN